MDPHTLSEMLELMSEADVQRRTSRQVRSLRGLRGVPTGEVARIAAAAWNDDPPALPTDEDALGTLFGTAWEDGLVAIGLLAAALPDDPAEALGIGLDWLERTDDLQTADAIGWLVLGPGALASNNLAGLIARTRRHARIEARRAGVMAGMAMCPVPIEGPSAAPLRARLGVEEVQFVEAAVSDGLATLADAFLRDESPQVRKALRRVLGAWGRTDPDACEAWRDGVKGGLPRMIQDELKKAIRKGRRA